MSPTLPLYLRLVIQSYPKASLGGHRVHLCTIQSKTIATAEIRIRQCEKQQWKENGLHFHFVWMTQIVCQEYRTRALLLSQGIVTGSHRSRSTRIRRSQQLTAVWDPNRMKNELEQVEVGVTFSNSLFDYAHSFYSLDSFRMLYTTFVCLPSLPLLGFMHLLRRVKIARMAITCFHEPSRSITPS